MTHKICPQKPYVQRNIDQDFRALDYKHPDGMLYPEDFAGRPADLRCFVQRLARTVDEKTRNYFAHRVATRTFRDTIRAMLAELLLSEEKPAIRKNIEWLIDNPFSERTWSLHASATANITTSGASNQEGGSQFVDNTSVAHFTQNAGASKSFPFTQSRLGGSTNIAVTEQFTTARLTETGQADTSHPRTDFESQSLRVDSSLYWSRDAGDASVSANGHYTHGFTPAPDEAQQRYGGVLSAQARKPWTIPLKFHLNGKIDFAEFQAPLRTEHWRNHDDRKSLESSISYAPNNFELSLSATNSTNDTRTNETANDGTNHLIEAKSAWTLDAEFLFAASAALAIDKSHIRYRINDLPETHIASTSGKWELDLIYTPLTALRLQFKIAGEHADQEFTIGAYQAYDESSAQFVLTDALQETLTDHEVRGEALMRWDALSWLALNAEGKLSGNVSHGTSEGDALSGSGKLGLELHYKDLIAFDVSSTLRHSTSNIIFDSTSDSVSVRSNMRWNPTPKLRTLTTVNWSQDVTRGDNPTRSNTFTARAGADMTLSTAPNMELGFSLTYATSEATRAIFKSTYESWMGEVHWFVYY